MDSEKGQYTDMLSKLKAEILSELGFDARSDVERHSVKYEDLPEGWGSYVADGGGGAAAALDFSDLRGKGSVRDEQSYQDEVNARLHKSDLTSRALFEELKKLEGRVVKLERLLAPLVKKQLGVGV